MNRSGLCYQARGESAENLKPMRLINEESARRPFEGSRKPMLWLHGQAHRVGRHRVRRLMRLMGLEALYPKPRLSQPGEGHKIYPYRLNGVAITRVTPVWSTDIPYLRMAQGFAYLVAVMAWFSHLVLSRALSPTLEIDLRREALERAPRQGRPEIFNSDQGSQFTPDKFNGVLAQRGVTVSTDGRGRCLDSIFIERRWRSPNTRRSTGVTTHECRRREPASAPGSLSTATSAFTKAWTTGLLRSVSGTPSLSGLQRPVRGLCPRAPAT